MMFLKQFHPGIADGTITRTWRYWRRPQVKAGNLYKVNPIGHIRVDDVRAATIAELAVDDPAACGFPDMAALRSFLDGNQKDDAVLYRIDFQFEGVVAAALPDTSGDLSAADLVALERALSLRDRNSGEAWTRATLQAVAAHPGQSSAVLAVKLGRDRAALKKDMRKLKALGLTISLETGYRLSPKGAAWIATRQRGG